MFPQVAVIEIYRGKIHNPENGGLYEVKNTDGNVIVSRTILIYLMPGNVRKMTEQNKVTCGCKLCIQANVLRTK